MNFDAQINLPFLGSLTIGQFLIVVAGLYFGWPLMPQIFAGLRSGFVSLVRGLGGLDLSGPSPSLPAAPSAADVDEAVAALQRLTAWAVANGSAELVDQITPLFRHLQAHRRPPK